MTSSVAGGLRDEDLTGIHCATASTSAVCSAIYSGSERGGLWRKWKPSRIAVGLERQTW
jgi:hypothetical protein